MADLPSNITSARDTASQLAGVSGEYAAGEQSVIDALTSKIREAYSANQDIIGKLDQATQGYYNAPSEARVKYQDIFNPFQRENLASQYTSNKAIPMLSMANLLGSRLGGIQGLVEAGTRAYGAQSARAQSKAQIAQQQYTNLLNEYELTQTKPSTDTVTANGRVYLIDKTTGKVISDLGVAPASSSGTNITISGIDIPGRNTQQVSGITLTDPNTGKVYSYSSVSDPDYISDYKTWYGNKQETPTPGQIKGRDIYSQPYG